VLGPDHPCLDDVRLIVSELVTNAIQHGSPSESSSIRVVVRPTPGAWVFVSVTDEGRDDTSTPAPAKTDLTAVRGRGLALVDELAFSWGVRRNGGGYCVYALVNTLEQRDPTPVAHSEKEQIPVTSATKPMPKAFMLVGHGGPHVLDDHGTPPTIIDAEGVQLLSGAVYAWCHADCCPDRPRSWTSVEAAADYHGSLILFPDEAPRDPKDR